MAQYARKRKVERIRLTFPILGRVGSTDVVLLDISLHGCRIEHTVPIKVANRIRIQFHWEHERLDLDGEVVRSNLNSFAAGQNGLTVYHSGVRFESVEGESVGALRKLITEQITRALAEQKANARGDIPKYIDQMAIFTQGMLTANPSDVAAAYDGETSLPNLRIARERGYLSYTLDKNQWRKRRTRN